MKTVSKNSRPAWAFLFLAKVDDIKIKTNCICLFFYFYSFIVLLLLSFLCVFSSFAWLGSRFKELGNQSAHDLFGANS